MREYPALPLEQGTTFGIWVNQGWRDAYVLVIEDYQALVEYQMPGGTTALLILDAETRDFIRRVPYKRVPKKFLKSMVEQGLNWIGQPQQNQGKRVYLREVVNEHLG